MFYKSERIEKSISDYWNGDKSAFAQDCWLSRPSVYFLIAGKNTQTGTLDRVWVEINKKRRSAGHKPVDRKYFIN